ncbi:MAG: hypothetical protein KGI06_04420 [Candidatus Micrarchaeota archaeon]|nr:hypothetical protein [Candidatus Micrarchaeota archaeon]
MVTTTSGNETSAPDGRIREYLEPLGGRRKGLSEKNARLLSLIRTEDLHPKRASANSKEPYFSGDGWSNR